MVVVTSRLEAPGWANVIASASRFLSVGLATTEGEEDAQAAGDDDFYSQIELN